MQAFKQLIKGKDDLRQDAVMQQFFALVNSLLDDDAAAARRNLRLRVYKVVAFSGEAGLLEWVDGTTSLNSYLAGSRGAHARYAQMGQLTHEEIQRMVFSTQTESRDRARWVAVYNEACARFPPVLRRFFTERYHSAALWCANLACPARPGC